MSMVNEMATLPMISEIDVVRALICAIVRNEINCAEGMSMRAI
jgi:hypothetical protein